VELLEQKQARVTKVSAGNYAFYGTLNYNLEEVLKADYGQVCGLKIFKGSKHGQYVG